MSTGCKNTESLQVRQLVKTDVQETPTCSCISLDCGFCASSFGLSRTTASGDAGPRIANVSVLLSVTSVSAPLNVNANDGASHLTGSGVGVRGTWIGDDVSCGGESASGSGLCYGAFSRCFPLASLEALPHKTFMNALNHYPNVHTHTHTHTTKQIKTVFIAKLLNEPSLRCTTVITIATALMSPTTMAAIPLSRQQHSRIIFVHNGSL